MRVAAEVGWTARLETAYYVLHGILHLSGHDDLAPGPRRAMRHRVRGLNRWGLETEIGPARAASRRAPGMSEGTRRRRAMRSTSWSSRLMRTATQPQKQARTVGADSLARQRASQRQRQRNPKKR